MFRHSAGQTRPDTEALTVRQLEGPAEFELAQALYRSVFDYDDPGAGLNPRLLAALRHHGGSVVGVFDPADPADLLGFAYGFPAVGAEGEHYHYSQAAVVATQHQGLGIGRLLKLGQAAVARDRGATHMRWSYDPLLARNAHFNLDVLGARGRWFVADLYGPGTDRVIVEWDLAAKPPEHPGRLAPAPIPPDASWGVPVEIENGDVVIPIPDHLATDDPLRSLVRQRLRAAFPRLFAAGMLAVSCERTSPSVCAYQFTKR